MAASSTAKRQRQARNLLRQVDDQLKRFGPRRAIERLTKVKFQAPYGTCRQFNDYLNVLEGMTARNQKLYQDAEVEQEEE